MPLFRLSNDLFLPVNRPLSMRKIPEHKPLHMSEMTELKPLLLSEMTEVRPLTYKFDLSAKVWRCPQVYTDLEPHLHVSFHQRDRLLLRHHSVHLTTPHQHQHHFTSHKLNCFHPTCQVEAGIAFFFFFNNEVSTSMEYQHQAPAVINLCNTVQVPHSYWKTSVSIFMDNWENQENCKRPQHPNLQHLLEDILAHDGTDLWPMTKISRHHSVLLYTNCAAF